MQIKQRLIVAIPLAVPFWLMLNWICLFSSNCALLPSAWIIPASLAIGYVAGYSLLIGLLAVKKCGAN